MADVFISYAREDRGVCEAVAKALKALKLEVWYDTELQSGSRYDEVIEAKLQESKAAIVLWSKNAVESQWVKDEARFAKKRNVLVVVRLDGCDLPLGFGGLHSERLSGAETFESDAGWPKLVDHIGKLVGRPSLGTVAHIRRDFAREMSDWMSANPTDQLSSQRLEPPSMRLRGRPSVEAARSRRWIWGLLGLALGSGLASAGAATFYLWQRNPAPVVEPAPPVDRISMVALDLVGEYTNPDPEAAEGECLSLMLGDGSLRWSGSDPFSETIVGLDQDGWLVTETADGVRFAYKKESETLRVRKPSSPDYLPLEPCR
jgi:hypothetical protein